MKLRKKIITLSVLISLLFMFFYYAGYFLVLDEKPKKSDVIIILGGDQGARIHKGVTLYKDGYAPYIIVSGEITQANLLMASAVKSGVPKEIIILEQRAESTYENALFSKEIMEQYGFKTAIVVSSNYHMRRVRMIFEKVFDKANMTFTYCSVQEPNFSPSHWWLSEKSIQFTLTEYGKTLAFLFGGGR
ncbi:MAG: hypothetical protein XD78_1157 [Desulfotomaculum sp. 46_296]|nr:MAG: hypothetical protein XD78_1157 [Desulfotomaculum sp. 46_296]HAU32386.1 YdcF family protein [Desulfotomaculum sp.]